MRNELVRLVRFAALIVAVALLANISGVAAAAQTTVECGIFHSYTAPNPGGPTNGSVTFGVLGGTPEVIDANATLSPPADSVLASLGGGPAPTCLSVTRDAGVITAMALAPTGTISGLVTLAADLFGPGQDAYVIANRLVSPVSAVIADPGLAALIKTAFDAGSTLSATLNIDVTTGFPSSFTVTTTISGPVKVLPLGDVQVGKATLPAAVIDAGSLKRLKQAATLGVAATVVISGVGTPTGSGVNVVVTLSVSFTAPTPTPSPAPTSLPNTAFR